MAKETSVEHEYFTNPTEEQVDALKSAVERDKGDSNRDGVDNDSSKTIDNILEPEKETETEKPALEEDKEEKTISYIEKDTGKELKYSTREWEDEWNKNKVENQWHNLGRDREDMYDKYSGLDFNGKDASKEMSSIDVPKTEYLKGLYEKDEQGKYKYEDKLNARKEARSENSILSKAIDGATALYDKTIGKAIDKVSAYKKDIGEKAREASDKRNEAYTNDAKLLAESNLGASQPEKKVTLEYDATKLQDTSANKPEVKMRVEGIEKPITKTQVDEIKKKATKDLDFMKSYYERNPGKALETIYSTIDTENEVYGLTYYDKAKVVALSDNEVMPTGTLTTELGHRVDVNFNPKGLFSKDNLKSMFGIGPGQQIGTATIYLEDGSTKTYSLHQTPRISSDITVADENGKQVGYNIYPNTADAFMSDLSNTFDEIPGQAIYEDSPTVKAALEKYNECIAEKERQIKALDNAEVDMESLSDEWNRSVENSTPTVKVSDENAGKEKEIIETSKGLENTLNQFTRPEDKEAASQWYNTYTPRIKQAIENAKVDSVGNAGQLANVLDEAKNALKPYANETFTNFNRAVNDYVGAVAGTYFINTQLYDKGVTADNAKEGLVDRIRTAYNSDKMSFGQKVLYSLGFGSKETETDKGVMQLRNIAEQSLGRTSNLSENFKGAVMSSLLAQSVDNKSPIKNIMKDFLTFTGVQAINALSGFNPVVVGVTSLYAVSKGFERLLEEKTFKERNADNQKRLETIKGGKDQSAMPSTKSENVYNVTTRGTGQDIKHAVLGVSNVVAGTIAVDPALIAFGVNELLQIDSLNASVKEFVGPENLSALEAVAAPTGTSREETSDEKKKKKNITELEEVVTDGNKQEGLDGINLPSLSDEDLMWLIKQPYMQNYSYE